MSCILNIETLSLIHIFGIVKTIEWYLANQAWVEEVTSGDYQGYYEKMYGKN